VTPAIGHNGGPAFLTLEDMVVATAEGVRPPERIPVSEAAELYHVAKAAGVSAGKYDLSLTPYLREPMDELTSEHFTGMAFAGPARTGKSAMAVNWLCHIAITDPNDMLFVHMAQHTGRIWSMQDLEKAIVDSPELRKRMVPGRQNDNVFDKKFMNGMRAMITWPTIKNLSGLTVRYQFILDMDRIKPQLIDGEAHVFDATRKRGGTFKRRAMCAAEGSPGFPVQNAKWIPSSPHEAPPTEGILSIYNRGDRRRWYWECPHCAGKFEPHFKLLRWPDIKDSKDFMDAAEQCWMECPHCFKTDGAVIKPSMQRQLNQGGKWIKDGQLWLPDGSITGEARRSRIASFWMFGPAAGFTDWPLLVGNFLEATAEYEKTGDESTLMTTTNVDQGDAYTFKALEAGRLPETLKSRAEEFGGHDENGDPYVPAGTRFIVATIDVQAGARPSFVAHWYGVGANFDIFHIDMQKIIKSARLNEIGEREGLDPAAFPEDWDLLIDQVIGRSFPLGDGRRMAVKITACDSGGADGVTANAYEFYRRLRNDGRHKRFHLVKGAPSRAETAPLRVSYPNSQQKDKFAIARGDVPVWLVNSNIVKDQVSNMLGRAEPGGQVHFPKWSPDWLYTQLTTEIRDPATGVWSNPSRRKNEAFDLLAYCVAILDHPDIRMRFIDWTNPPPWAGEWDVNDFVFSTEAPFDTGVAKPRKSLAELADDLL
jgi:phage terminase large subunit GpA-like protein